MAPSDQITWGQFLAIPKPDQIAYFRALAARDEQRQSDFSADYRMIDSRRSYEWGE